jgi:hypothetical protein
MSWQGQRIPPVRGGRLCRIFIGCCLGFGFGVVRFWCFGGRLKTGIFSPALRRRWTLPITALRVRPNSLAMILAGYFGQSFCTVRILSGVHVVVQGIFRVPFLCSPSPIG